MKRHISKESSFEILGHEFNNLSELMDAVEVEVHSMNNYKQYCPEVNRKPLKDGTHDLHVLMFVSEVTTVPPQQEYINGYEHCYPDGTVEYVSHHDPIPLYSEEEMESRSYTEYKFFFSSEPFADLMVGSLWGWLDNGIKNLPLCVFPMVEFCSEDNYLTVYDDGMRDLFIDDSEKDDFSDDLFYKEGLNFVAEESTNANDCGLIDNDILSVVVDDYVEEEKFDKPDMEKCKSVSTVDNSETEKLPTEVEVAKPTYDNFKVKFEEISKDKPFEVMGHVFQSLEDLLDSVDVRQGSRRTGILNRIEPKKPVPGLHILEIYELYPCFDSYDYANENRFYCNYFFSSKSFTDEEVEILRNIKQMSGVCLVNENTPQWALPALYYKGEGYTMLLATIEKK